MSNFSYKIEDRVISVQNNGIRYYYHGIKKKKKKS